jgi:hypothetical protein
MPLSWSVGLPCVPPALMTTPLCIGYRIKGLACFTFILFQQHHLSISHVKAVSLLSMQVWTLNLTHKRETFETLRTSYNPGCVHVGMFMDLSLGPHVRITSATLNLFDTVAIIVLVPIYDLVLIPFLRKRGIEITYLQRIGWGLVVGSLCTLSPSSQRHNLDLFQPPKAHQGPLDPPYHCVLWCCRPGERKNKQARPSSHYCLVIGGVLCWGLSSPSHCSPGQIRGIFLPPASSSSHIATCRAIK